ncbi:hypothetical protein H8959_020543 [Pygathrix nigripes]
MRALENDFFNSPPRKTVRFGGTVTEVLLKYKKGETSDFELLKNQLLDPDVKDDQIINWLLEFHSSIMYLTKDFEQLISIILDTVVSYADTGGKECYVHNLLRISVYFPTLRHEILELIIEKLLKLDKYQQEAAGRGVPSWPGSVAGGQPTREYSPAVVAAGECIPAGY